MDALERLDRDECTPADDIGWSLLVLADDIDNIPTALAADDEHDGNNGKDPVREALSKLNLSCEGIERDLILLADSYPSVDELPECFDAAYRLLEQVEIELDANTLAHRERTDWLSTEARRVAQAFFEVD